MHNSQNRYQFERSELINSKMHLIDYGSSQSFLDEQGVHIPKSIEELKPERNIVFASKNYFNGTTLSRRDDIISIVYNLLYLMNPHTFKIT
jgi:hypothetical protein